MYVILFEIIIIINISVGILSKIYNLIFLQFNIKNKIYIFIWNNYLSILINLIFGILLELIVFDQLI